MRAKVLIGAALLALGVAFLLASPSPALADNLNDCRSSSSDAQIIANGNWDNGGFQICWNVSFDFGTELWSYTYTITESIGSQGGLSHIIIELSPGLTDILLDGSTPPAGAVDTHKAGDGPGGNPGMPGDMYGIKVEDGEDLFVFTLTTPVGPVWGDFYAKNGKFAGFAHNTGFGNPDIDPTTDVLTGVAQLDHIVVPDTRRRPPEEEVPEPGSALLIGAGLVGVAAVGRGKRVKMVTV